MLVYLGEMVKHWIAKHHLMVNLCAYIVDGWDLLSCLALVTWSVWWYQSLTLFQQAPKWQSTCSSISLLPGLANISFQCQTFLLIAVSQSSYLAVVMDRFRWWWRNGFSDIIWPEVDFVEHKMSTCPVICFQKNMWHMNFHKHSVSQINVQF